MVKLSSVAEILNGDRSSNYPSGKDFVAFGIPFINAGHLTKGKIDFSNMDYISEQKYQQLSGAKIRKHDILLCLRGSLGKYAVSEIDAGAPASSIAVIRPNKSLIDAGYLTCIISSFVFQRQIDLENNGSSQPNLSASSVSSFTIPLPPVNEQQHIAEALSDVDGMISSLEKLIAKKKAIKQGAMQELLTGQKRLPGFTGEWMSVLFKDIYEFAKEGGTPSTSNAQYYHNGKIPFIKIEHLFSKYIESGKEFITEEGLNNSSAWLIPTESIIFSNGATIGEISINKIPVSTKQGILGIIPKASFITEFLYYYFSTEVFLNCVKNITTHGTMDVAYLKDINNIELVVPENKKEQTAIASILSDMDNEIEALEQKLAKTRQIKQGMMQQLLTGKIRLV